ncbi:hypothetical protein GGH95_002902, partial [Coemansia sp. RSA 1836]
HHASRTKYGLGSPAAHAVAQALATRPRRRVCVLGRRAARVRPRGAADGCRGLEAPVLPRHVRTL